MHSLSYFRVQFKYNKWANEEAARMLRGLDRPDSSMLKVLAHIAAAEVLWLDRIQGRKSEMPVWPELTITEFVGHAVATSNRYLSFLDEISEEEYTRPVAYTNSKGEPWASRVEEILMHVLLHGAYHRGQLAMMVRKAGGQPVLTDFIHAIRSGIIENDS